MQKEEKKDPSLTKKFLAVTLVLVLASGFAAVAADNPLTSFGVHKTKLGLGISLGTSSQLGELQWKLSGQKIVDSREHEYHRVENKFGVEGIIYPEVFSVGASGIELKLGVGAEALVTSFRREVWISDQHLEEKAVTGEAYLLGSLRSAVCLNLSKDVEKFALTEDGIPEPSPVWSLLDPFYFIVDLQAGPGLSTEAPYFKFKAQGAAVLEYRF